MLTTVPYIPDNAPFSSEQRAWLNGFLAGLFSSKPQETSTSSAPLRIAVYFATQSGTAERLAKKLVKELRGLGHQLEVTSLDKTSLEQVAAQEHALFLVSTYGEGDPPDGAKSFYAALFGENAPKLTALRYSVFCLGDRNYEQFCKFGIELDERLHALGGTRWTPRMESDVEVNEPFEQWKKSLQAQLTGKPESGKLSPQTDVPSKPEPAPIHTRENPFHAPLRERTPLTSDASSKLTVHLSFGLEDSPVHYQAGDACGVIAENDPGLVSEILSLLPFDATAMVEIPKYGSFTLEEALLRHLQPTRLTRKMVQAFAGKTQSKSLAALLPPEQSGHLETYMHDRGLIDLLYDYPGVLETPEELVGLLPRLSPRLYSISSSPAAHGREVHCTVAVVRYRSHNRERGGIASTMLAERVDPGKRLPIYIQPNKKFRLPAGGDTPIIMIGPGTGIAPFRSFLHERRALGYTGRNWLFFGERSAKTDFLYCRELRSMVEDGHLTRLDTAFSRDQAKKIYVQDRMVEHGSELWRWLNEGAQLFVCGDASRMAKDVDAALHRVVEKHGGMDADAAMNYVSQLHEDRRYHHDVY
ncbi:MAG TPA: flavodoxin domain-containing protein [Acidobacteriaceae bacterium]|jgi:sulfite reductase (NADPH) flavoprotein alpha-component